MHTKVTKYNGKEARIHHNGDWSGLATVTWTDDSGNPQEVSVPAVVCVAAAREIVSDAAANVGRMLSDEMKSIEERAGQ